MITTATASSVAAGICTPRPNSQSTKPSEKFSAAKALPRKPDRVMATWIVARKRAGWLVKRANRIARLSPAAAIFASLASLIEITAISALAKTALSRIRKTCSRIMKISESFKGNSSLLLAGHRLKNTKRHSLSRYSRKRRLCLVCFFFSLYRQEKELAGALLSPSSISCKQSPFILLDTILAEKCVAVNSDKSGTAQNAAGA